MGGKRQSDITGQRFNEWIVTEYIGKSKYSCTCSECGATKNINGYFLQNGQIPKCSHNKVTNDLTGQQFGEWTVLKYTGKKRYLCRCSCGVEKEILAYTLRHGESKSCGHALTKNRLQDLTGQQIGEWTVLKYLGFDYTVNHGKYLCKCSCGVEKEVAANRLRNGSSKSCGHSTTGFKDLTGMQFGEWLVLELSGHKDKGNNTYWICQCSCGSLRDVSSYALRSGKSKSCGCMANIHREESCLKIYGVKHAAQAKTTRTTEQLQMIDSKENLINTIKNNFKEPPGIIQLAELLGISRGSTRSFIQKYELEEYIRESKLPISGYEKALQEYFPCQHISDKTVLDGKELDLFYPDKRIAIEFNGNYWHSELKKPKLYHQEKSIKAAKKNIHIIHIFEYEWNSKDTKNKLLELIRGRLYGDRLEKIYARSCEVREVKLDEAHKFLDTYHLQSNSPASVYIGLFYKNILVGIMTFGAPRFNREYDCELIRLAWKHGIKVVGGSEKMFKYFVRKYSPNNIISYCDFSKFNGDVYRRLGFSYDKLTQPNYKWIDLSSNDVLSRYKTSKQRLVNMGLGDVGKTEDEIMQELGYIKIYDCGNLRFIWER